jgi:hypothetical protein
LPSLCPGGQLLVLSEDSFRECYASHFTDADVEDFRTIARQYAVGYEGVIRYFKELDFSLTIYISSNTLL